MQFTHRCVHYTRHSWIRIFNKKIQQSILFSFHVKFENIPMLLCPMVHEMVQSQRIFDVKLNMVE